MSFVRRALAGYGRGPALAVAAILSAGALLPAATPTATAAPDVVFDVGLFFDALAPQGEWVTVDPYGWVWTPTVDDYAWRPYTVGHWAWSDDYGWFWVSDEDWGWATYHYGRWAWTPEYGWVWIPGTVWAPAWVVYRTGADWVGWAPLPPESGWRLDSGLDVARLGVGVDPGMYSWSFVPLTAFAEPDLRTRVVSNAYAPALLRATTPTTRFVATDGRVVNRGVDPAVVEKARGSALPKFTLKDAGGDKPSRTRVEGNAITVFRPKLAPKIPPKPPAHAATVERFDRARLDDWTAKRRAALQAHLDAQRKALEMPNAPWGFPAAAPTGTPPAGGPPAMGTPPPPTPNAIPADELERRRAAARQAIEDERKRLEDLLERQRRRREKDGEDQGEGQGQGGGGGGGDKGHGKGMGD